MESDYRRPQDASQLQCERFRVTINSPIRCTNGKSRLYKAEVIHRRRPWRSFEAVEIAILECVDWFNNRRLLEPIGNIPLAEAEERHYAMLEQSDMAA